jgi:hypothetical protein
LALSILIFVRLDDEKDTLDFGDILQDAIQGRLDDMLTGPHAGQ